MRLSYQKLQAYFDHPLPPPEELGELITMHAFEVEAVTGDELEIKVLPDRAADAKTELGQAREISAITGLPLKAKFVEMPSIRTRIPFSVDQINRLLGLALGEFDIKTILARVRVKIEDGVVLIPADRLDLNIVEDLADEVGRLYGVYRVPPKPLAPRGAGATDPILAKADKIRETLVAAGYSEVYGYSLTNRGEREVEKPVAADKKFLRTNLSDGLREKIAFNLQHLLFDHEPVKLFEIGTVFTQGAEVVRVAVGIGYKHPKFKKESLPDFVVREGSDANLKPYVHLDRTYEPVSSYPRIIRDVAIWTRGEDKELVARVIKGAAGELLTGGPVSFDEFKKDGRISLAFRLALQSHEKTLSDDDANAVMSRVISALESHGWEVRK